MNVPAYCSPASLILQLSGLLSLLGISETVSVETVDTFHLPEDTSGCFPRSPDGSPYYPDEADCNCYYVCTKRQTAARMCCPADLWWDQESNKCLFPREFSLRKQTICEQNKQRKGAPPSEGKKRRTAKATPKEDKEKEKVPEKKVEELSDGEDDDADDSTYGSEDELTLDRYFAGLPEQYVYAFCALSANPTLPKSSQQIRGAIDFRQSLRGGPTDIHFNITGFDPEDGESLHGVHVHEFGDLNQGCSSAEGHYNPFGVVHGGPLDSPQFRHFGDLGNVEEDEKGRVKYHVSDYLVSLLGPFSALGRSVVVHELEDDLGRGNTRDSLVSGNAGARLACCTIGLSNGDRWRS